MKREIISFVLAASLAAASVCPASADGTSFTVPVNSVVQLGDNVVVASNAITQSELMKEYEESKSDIASNYADINSDRDKFFEELVPPILSDDEVKKKQSKSSEEMSFDEFYKQVYKPTLPDGDPEIENLKKKYDKKQKNLRNNNELTEDDMEAFDKAIESGINPLTGEPFPDKATFPGGVEVSQAGSPFDLDGLSLDEMTDFVKDIIDKFSKYQTKHADDKKNEFDDKYKEMMHEYLKEKNEGNLTDGYHWFIDHEDCTEDEYINDTLVYDNKSQDITDIKYRCAKCGKLYGFDQFCDCDKYLDGSVFYYDAGYDKNDAYADKRYRDEFNGDYSIDPDFLSPGDPWSYDYPDDSKYDGGFIYHCHSCFKTLSVYSLDYKSGSFDQFYIGSSGEILCSECYNLAASGKESVIMGSATEGQMGLNDHVVWADDMVTESEDPADWTKKDHWEKYIHPCKAVYPDGNFTSMMSAYRANLSDDALASFDENLAIFDAMSTSGKSPEENFNDYVNELAKSKDKNDQKRAKELKGSYAEFKAQYDAYQQAGGKEAFIDNLIIDSALEKADYSMIEHVKVAKDDYINDTLEYKANNYDITDIQYRCATCGQLYGFNKKCGCKQAKYLDGSAYYCFTQADNDGTPLEKVGDNIFTHFDTGSDDAMYNSEWWFNSLYNSWLGANTGEHNEFTSSHPMACSCGKPFCKDSILPTTDENDKFYFSSTGELKCSECMHAENKDVDSDDRDSSQWTIADPYYAPFISVCTALSTEEVQKMRMQEYINTLPQDQKQQAQMVYDNLFNQDQSDGTGSFGSDAVGLVLGDLLKDALGTMSGPNGTDVQSALDWLVKLMKNGQLNLDNENYEEWDIDDLKDMYKQMQKAQNDSKKQNGGLSQEEKDQKESEYGQDSESFGNQEKEKQLAEAKEAYADYLEKLGDRKEKVEEVSKGLFEPDMTQEEAAKAFRDYVAGYTSVTDKVTLVTTVDYSDIQSIGQGGSYDVKGNVRAIVVDESGKVVAEREAVAGTPMTWVAYQVGRYNVKRVVDVYHIEWDFSKCTATINAALVLPDGTSLEVISGREVTRIVENKDGLKQTNCHVYNAGDFTIDVVEDNINPLNSDFYDTERVK